MVEQTSKLPFGYMVRFRFDPPEHYWTEWQPDFPSIPTPAQMDEFLEAFFKARAEFAQTVATLTGCRITIVDSACDGLIAAVTEFDPETRQ